MLLTELPRLYKTHIEGGQEKEGVMAKARIKDEVFSKCDCVILMSPHRTSSYAGFTDNPYLPCQLCSDSTQVFINNRWWMIDPSEWHIIDKQDRFPEMYERKTNRKYNKAMRNVVPKKEQP